MTTVPSMRSPLRAERMASTAAWSAAFSSPRPIRREAARAAHSVTRTTSRARLRSMRCTSPMLSSAALILRFPGSAVPLSERLDAYHARRLPYRVKPGDLRQCTDHSRLLGLVRGEHDRHGLVGRPRALDHGLHRDRL